MKKILFISFIALIIDQFIKITISTKMLVHDSITIIINFFNITFVKNYGAAYSIFYGNTIFLILISIISLFLIYFFLIKNKELKKIDVFNIADICIVISVFLIIIFSKDDKNENRS